MYSFKHATDGLNFTCEFKPFDIALNLNKGDTMMGVDHNVRHVTDSLFLQDYGNTAGTLLSAVPSKYAITSKKVPLNVFVQQWNKHNSIFQKILRENAVPQQQYTSDSIIALLKIVTPLGSEPFYYSQMKSVSEITSSISMAGVVASLTTSGCAQTLFLANSAVESQINIAMIDVRARNPAAHCMKYYLVCYNDRMTDLSVDTVRFVVIASDAKATFFLQHLALGNDGAATVIRDSNYAAYMELGVTLATGTFIQNVDPEWQYHDLNTFNTNNILRLSRTFGCCQKRHRARQRRVIDSINYKSGHFRTVNLKHRTLIAS